MHVLNSQSVISFKCCDLIFVNDFRSTYLPIQNVMESLKKKNTRFRTSGSHCHTPVNLLLRLIAKGFGVHSNKDFLKPGCTGAIRRGPNSVKRRCIAIYSSKLDDDIRQQVVEGMWLNILCAMHFLAVMKS